MSPGMIPGGPATLAQHQAPSRAYSAVTAWRREGHQIDRVTMPGRGTPQATPLLSSRKNLPPAVGFASPARVWRRPLPSDPVKFRRPASSDGLQADPSGGFWPSRRRRASTGLLSPRSPRRAPLLVHRPSCRRMACSTAAISSRLRRPMRSCSRCLPEWRSLPSPPLGQLT